MGKTIVTENMFPQIVELYNTEGKTAVFEKMRSQFGIKRPYFVLRRIRNSGMYTYDEKNDKFISVQQSTGDDVFMDLDELCGAPSIRRSGSDERITEAQLPTMEKLVNELINDRLLTLSRYITLDSASRTIMIDQTSLAADGYRVVTH